jgi:hypothetical protein
MLASAPYHQPSLKAEPEIKTATFKQKGQTPRAGSVFDAIQGRADKK